MKKSILIIGNPKSGSGKTKKILKEIAHYLDSTDVNHWKILETEYSGQAREYAQHATSSTTTDLILVGGDGTFNEGINGLEKEIPVSFVSAGTGNDFLKNIDIGTSKDDSFGNMVNGKVHKIDVGVCNGRKFLNGVGVGFDGQIVTEMETRKVPLLKGHLKYYYHVLHILSSYRARSFDFKMDGKTRKEDLILLTIANGTTFGGGFKLTPTAKINSGVFEVCSIGPMSAMKQYLNIHKLQSGTHDSLKEVEIFNASEIEIGANPFLQGHIDGEFFGAPPFDITIRKEALQVRANRIL